MANTDQDRAGGDEKERLRFEGDLDRWMKVIGAGITGYQPEAYAVMDHACEELVDSRARIATLEAALREVKSWIDNWDPNFISDEEWHDTEARIEAALKTERGGE